MIKIKFHRKLLFLSFFWVDSNYHLSVLNYQSTIIVSFKTFSFPLDNSLLKDFNLMSSYN